MKEEKDSENKKFHFAVGILGAIVTRIATMVLSFVLEGSTKIEVDEKIKKGRRNRKLPKKKVFQKMPILAFFKLEIMVE